MIIWGGQPLHGKPLSYNNLLDLDAAWRAVRAFERPAIIAIIKHTNPCGLATAATLADAWLWCSLARGTSGTNQF